MKQLREYQVTGKGKLRDSVRAGNKRIVYYMPTGAGKSIQAVDLIQSLLGRGKRVAFLANRIGLVHQFSDHLKDAGIEHGVIQGNNTYGSTLDCVVCSIQTLAKRGLPPVDYVIIDECHAVAGSSEYRNLIFSMNNIHWIGLTATPFSKGMAKVYAELGNEPLFQDIVIAATIRELIDLGSLVDCEIYAPTDPDLTGVKMQTNAYGEKDYNDKQLGQAVDKPELIGDIVENWFKLASGKKTVVFATNVAHSKHIVEQFNASGVSAEHIDGYMDQEAKEPILQRYKAGETLIISNVAMLKEGWDAPDCEVMILAKPTNSLTAWIQMAGRILRPFLNKTHGIIIDHSGTVHRLGFPTDDLPLELCDGNERKKDEPKDVAKEKKEKKCEKCSFIKKTLKCPKCGHEAIIKNSIGVGEGEIEKVAKKPSRDVLQAWYSQLLCYAKSKGFKSGWAANQYKSKFLVWPRKLTDTHIQPSPEVLSWIMSRQIAYRAGVAKNKKLDSY